MAESKIKTMKLMKLIRSKGIMSKDLDELVTDLGIKMVANINNRGMNEQLRFIAKEAGGIDQAIKLINRIETGIGILSNIHQEADDGLKKILGEGTGTTKIDTFKKDQEND